MHWLHMKRLIGENWHFLYVTYKERVRYLFASTYFEFVMLLTLFISTEGLYCHLQPHLVHICIVPEQSLW